MRTRTFLILAAAAASLSTAQAEDARRKLVSSVPPAVAHPALVGQDPLMNEILRRQIAEPNGGVKGYAAPRSGPSIELEMGDAAPVLKVHPDLAAPEPPKAPAKKKSPRAATQQLETLKKQGEAQNWGEGAKRQPEPAAPSKLEIQ